jgi:hypothetical protein
MKTVFWHVMPCILVEITDVSEVLAVSIIRARPGRSEASSTRGPTDRLSVLFPPFLPEDGSRIQLAKRCTFIIWTMDKTQKISFTY